MLDGPGLAAFIATAEAGTVHAAAEQLAISQPALSRRIQRLEHSLGLSLFTRSGQRLRLSKAGAALLPAARMHLDGLNHALAAVRDDARYGGAAVTMGCLATLSTEILPRVLAGYTRKRPQVRLRVLDVSAREIEAAVKDGVADFALTMLGVPEPGLSQEFVGAEPMVLLASPDHPLSIRQVVRWGELGNHPLIAIGPHSANRRLMDSVQASLDIRLDWRHEVQRMSTAVSLVAAGAGVALLPQLAALPHRLSGLCAIPLVDPPVARRLGVIRRSGTALSPSADLLERACKLELRRRLSGDGAVADQ